MFEDVCVERVVCLLELLPCFQSSCVYAGVRWFSVESRVEYVRRCDVGLSCFQPWAKLCSGLLACLVVVIWYVVILGCIRV